MEHKCDGFIDPERDVSQGLRDVFETLITLLILNYEIVEVNTRYDILGMLEEQEGMQHRALVVRITSLHIFEVMPVVPCLIVTLIHDK